MPENSRSAGIIRGQLAATIPETLQSTAAMAESLQSTGVIPPQGFLPDDTDLVYQNGIPRGERDVNDPNYDDEVEVDWRDYERYIVLALEYYNRKHHTDYQPVPGFTVKGGTWIDTLYSSSNHFGFTAVPAEGKSAAKYFCCKLSRTECDGGVEEVVTSCVIVDGIQPTGCKICDERHKLGFISISSIGDEEDEETDDIPPPSQYAHDLADGVTLSDKAKYRIPFTLLALAYYNKKHHTDYKIVDVLPCCEEVGTTHLVAHCNFIARRNAGADASNELFFAELQKRKCSLDDWVVIACRVVRGKTRAGCYLCPRYGGRRVIHPTHGYRHGLYPSRPIPRLRSRDGNGVGIPQFPWGISILGIPTQIPPPPPFGKLRGILDEECC